MMEEREPVETTWMVAYPRSKWLIRVVKAPIALWRMGFGPILGKHLMVITHTGRVSGLPRRTVTEYHPAGETIYAPCAFGERSQWFRNLMADPLVTLQMDAGPVVARARRVTGEEELRRFYDVIIERNKAMFEAYMKSIDGDGSGFEDVLAHQEDLHIIAFDPSDEPGPPPVELDLKWVPVIAGVFGFLGVFLSRIINKKNRREK